MPHFETYILNYNGCHYLRPCLKALLALELGTHSLGINVVDNGSNDSSKQLIAEEFPEVNYIALGKNHGFSRGNNLGIKIRNSQLQAEGRQADFQILLNNDTEVDSKWLLAAYDVFAKNPQAGIVGGKALFADQHIPISISCANSYTPADYEIEDNRQMGALFCYDYTGSNINCAPGRVKFRDVYPGLGTGCILHPKSKVYIPVLDAEKNAWMVLYFESHHPASHPLHLSIRVGDDSLLKKVTILPNQKTPVFLNAQPQHYRRFIQNAGSFISNKWYAGDRGFLCEEEEGFDKVEQVAAVCGVSMFVRSQLWEKLGGFDESFFAYYEDTDLSVRAQQLGWRCYYTPHSRLKHVHAGSGVEFSKYFLKNVAWSHLLFSSKTMDRSQWRDKIKQSRTFADHEYLQFGCDHQLDSKPNLQAYFKYLRNYPRVLRNRVQANFSPPAKNLAGLLCEDT